MRLLLLCILSVCFFLSEAQSTREVEAKPSAPVYQATKSKKKFSFSRLFKKKDDGPKLPMEQQKDFEKRMKGVAKQKAKEAKIADKPQYADKSYFGH